MGSRGAWGRERSLGGAGSLEDPDPRRSAVQRPQHPQGGAADPSPIEATFSGKRGVPAQPLLAASAAPQLAGEPAPKEGPAPPHLLAASLPLLFLSSGREPPPPPSSSSSILPPPGLCAPPAATGWEARPPPPREGGGGASRGGHPRLRRGTRSEAPGRPSIWTRHAGTACAPPAEGRGAWPRRGVEEVRASLGRAAGPLLEREGREDPSLCLLLLFLLPHSSREAREAAGPGGILGRPGQRQGRG